MRAKYAIQDSDFYNFDETGFMIGVICGNMIVTHADQRGRGKQLQPGNREWATVIECVSSNGCVNNVITPIPLPLSSPVRSTVPLSRNRGSATRIGGKYKDKVLYRGIGGV